MSEARQLPGWLRRLIARRLAVPIAAPSTDRQRRVCLYKVDRIGDFVLALGALRLLAQRFDPAQCRLIISESAAPLAAAELPELECWTLPASAAGVWREMRPLRRRLAPAWAKEKFETIVCLRHARSLYRDLTLSWIGASEWFGLEARPTPATLTLANHPELPANYPVSAELPWCRELLAHRAVAEAALGRAVTWDEMRPRLRAVTAPAGREIVLCPFGGERIRDYPRAAWLAAWRGAIDGAAEVRVLGPADRRSDLEQLAADLRTAGASAIVTADATATQFVHHLAAARLILTVESAAAHLATALDRPAVIVMGGGHYGWFAPWGEGTYQRWVQHPLDCFGCNWHCRRPRVECLVDLPASQVSRAIREVLPRE